jgi:hypothetical protein
MLERATVTTTSWRSGGDHRKNGDHLNSMPRERDQKVYPESDASRVSCQRVSTALPHFCFTFDCIIDKVQTACTASCPLPTAQELLLAPHLPSTSPARPRQVHLELSGMAIHVCPPAKRRAGTRLTSSSCCILVTTKLSIILAERIWCASPSASWQVQPQRTPIQRCGD